MILSVLNGSEIEYMSSGVRILESSCASAVGFTIPISSNY